MTRDELLARLRLVPDATEEIISLIKEIDYAEALKEWKPDAAWEALKKWKPDAAGDASLLAGMMVVDDLVARNHLDFALDQFLWWLQFRRKE